ncbi:putative pentatricopeptide repeat-containing protein At5g40405 [Eucalyptus grandis]|uniref:putative pentatricopeptide repeat-containing protein At5g40405 n=1 Tax=Eucalyptus grandis TaxID=71139 RepID=UPI00192E8993|nr:putative pentatricopeptide repeat-containing protein At5g40405 [Eucalyptus grandis]XP_039172370.1 putative pentatricopeptide repeat-containing protein At5g40405 [Eucalyptus grandis]
MSSLKIIAKHPSISQIDSSTTLRELRQIHAHLLLNGLLTDPHLSGQFVAAIALRNPDNLDYSGRVLDRCEEPTLFSLNSMIRVHSKGPTPQKSFHFYGRIRRRGLSPDNYTFSFLVRACAQLLARGVGEAVHGALVRHGFESDPHVQSGLINMYAEMGSLESCRRVFGGILDHDVVCQTAMLSASAKLGDVAFAKKLFDEMPERDTVTWNAMIAGYAQCGEPRQALNLFHEMQLEGVKVNEPSMVPVLSACTQLGVLDQGRWAHAYIEKNRLRMTLTLGTALIDMYAKCGDMDKAMEVFWGMKERNVYTWSSAMNGLAMNGAGKECLELFSLMKKDGVLPNEVTFVSVLRGCSVVGLVEEGCKHFVSMTELYGIQPELEHYGCMVDLYGRAGRLNEALKFINDMPVEPHAGAWGALLNASKIHKNMEIGELASRKMLELEAKSHGAYVLLSNIYAENKSWEGVSHVRQVMKSRGVKKLPGCSVVEVDGEVHEFFVGDNSHQMYNEIKVMLGEIFRRLRLSGYMADTNPVLFDIEEEEKENALSLHSEKIATAFGLIRLKKDIPIRIVKNLRICWDCHDFMKMVSRTFDREIVVRDNNRFHHFRGGGCSCRDYW